MDKSSRREFASRAVITAASAPFGWTQQRAAGIFALSGQPPVARAVEQLRRALGASGYAATVRNDLAELRRPGLRIVVAPANARQSLQVAAQARVKLPEKAESLALIAGKIGNQSVLLATGADAAGIAYAVLELADRVQHAADIAAISSVVEQPVNPVRSIARLFCSDVEDKPWFHDQSFWRAYFGMLMAQRFNRFSLTLGLGYDLPRRVVDSYFIFSYPYLLTVPGYDVKVTGLAPGERERNLATLKWISSEAAAQGLHFQLGLWSHTYELIDSPRANHTIQGLTPATHAAYCRDALGMLLGECPSISGITFRSHSESGVPDGSYDFWRTVFSAVKNCGRRVEIDLHSKGIGAQQIRMALETGQPVKVSPKLTAEHMGLPAHQAAIREQELRRASSTPQERSFTRYGYADYLPEDREYGVYFRIWPGTQKLLLWGDPAMAAGYGRHAGFCGALGIELCEPLSFKGRHGSGRSPDRRYYADESLIPHGGDWRKYLYTYRLWGRRLYNPGAGPEDYRRFLRKEYGPAAAAPVESALGLASRIHPLVTSAHLPSASGLSYWQELYTNLPIVEGIPHPFGEVPPPRVFGHVSPLDPALFCSVQEFAATVLSGKIDPRYTPADVALWLERMAAESEAQLAAAKAKGNPADPSFRRMEIDVTVCNCFGRFFANKQRAAVAYAIYQQNGSVDSLRYAVSAYRAAREAWTGIVRATRGAYLDDVTFGEAPQLRGHWADRLPAIDRDLQAMERAAGGQAPIGTPEWLKPRLPAPACTHREAATFRPGEPLSVELSGPVKSAAIHYRRVNQSESYKVEEMAATNGAWRYTIPGEFTGTVFPLMYFFEVRDGTGRAWLYPGLDAGLSNQPYYVVRRNA